MNTECKNVIMTTERSKSINVESIEIAKGDLLSGMSIRLRLFFMAHNTGTDGLKFVFSFLKIYYIDIISPICRCCW